uniref:Uncharacterized protein n=1 Tax=Glossina palpalis gambiensis TaxID=67801 RepID=A0A1B0BZ26_9MUSC
MDVVDNGPASYSLCLETGDVTICKSSQIEKLLKDFNIENCRPIATSLDFGRQIKSSSSDCHTVDLNLRKAGKAILRTKEPTIALIAFFIYISFLYAPVQTRLTFLITFSVQQLTNPSRFPISNV